jgi:hypothetical protein
LSTRKTLLLLALSAVLSLGAVACGPGYVGVGTDDVGVEVGFAPPEFRAEAAIDTPGPGYFWVPGYYDWQGGNYVWISGQWVRPPHESETWVAPRYERRGSHYMYYRGHWRGDRDHRDRDHEHDNDRH